MAPRKNSLTGKPRVAMMTCVRNEARFVAAHLLYHRAIGVQRAYVFLDRCTDGTDQIVASLPGVRAIRVNPEDAARFPYVPDLQRECMDRALEMAREEGFDWLMGIDVDEYFAAGSPRSWLSGKSACTATPDLPAMLGRLPTSTEVVRIRPEEVLPVDVESGGPLWRQTYFLQRGRYVRETLDPRTNEVFEWVGMIGHRHGKSIVRTSADVQALDAHGWTRNQGVEYPCRPPTCKMNEKFQGRLLHYVISDWEHWYEKHRKLSHEPAKWRNGAMVETTKQCWKDAASQMNAEQAREYFRRWVATSDSRIQELLAKGQVSLDRSVEQTLIRTSLLVNGELQIPAATPNPIDDWTLSAKFWERAKRVTGIKRLADGGLELRPPELTSSDVDGLLNPRSDGATAYAWTRPECFVRFQLVPGDYDLKLRVARRTNWSRVRLALDGRELPADRRSSCKCEATYRLRQDDFTAGSKHELFLKYELSLYSKRFQHAYLQRGIALTDIAFIPLQTATKMAA